MNKNIISKRIAELGIKSNPEIAFKLKHQQLLGQTTLPDSAPKHARDLAAATPWTGSESVPDQVLRMLNDSHKRLKKSNAKRLHNAREHSIDYKYNEGETFSDRVKPERNTSSGVSTGGSINSIANQRIEDAIARGQFKDLPRGKQISRNEYKMLNPYIDTTELILNRMIKKQGVAPPWILKQKSMHEQVATFKDSTIKQITTMMVHYLVDTKEPINRKLLNNSKSMEWRVQQQNYHEIAVESLNSVIRGYNLQAPQSARKGYLHVDQVIDECFNSALLRVKDALDLYNGEKKVEPVKGLHKGERGLEDPNKQYGLVDMIKGYFYNERRN